MTRQELINQIKEKQSFLCVGLDTDIEKIPKHLLEFEDPVFEFNKQIIEATKEYTVAYKPNIAFYESAGISGMESLRKTLEIIPDDCFTIADAKRGDIGNTARMYAQAFFDKASSGFNFDSITVAPYMGADSVTPFLEFENKWAIVLGLTSNVGALDFQQKSLESGKRLFEEVTQKVCSWGTAENLMFVVGATHPEKFEENKSLALLESIIENNAMQTSAIPDSIQEKEKELSANIIALEKKLKENDSRVTALEENEDYFVEYTNKDKVYETYDQIYAWMDEHRTKDLSLEKNYLNMR